MIPAPRRSIPAPWCDSNIHLLTALKHKEHVKVVIDLSRRGLLAGMRRKNRSCTDVLALPFHYFVSLDGPGRLGAVRRAGWASLIRRFATLAVSPSRATST